MINSKILILILGISLTLISYNNGFSQTYDSTKKVVELPLKKYKAIRNKLLFQDSIIYNNNIIIEDKNNIIILKDSIIKLDSLKQVSFNKELIIKNTTIDTLSREYKNLSKDYNKINEELSKEKKSLLNNYKFWIGLVGGILLEVLITKR